MNRSQLLRTVSDKTGMAKKEVETVYEHLIHTVADSVKKGEKVALSGFGNFTQRVRKAIPKGKPVRNPFTGETSKHPGRPAQKLPKFVPAKQFKEYVSGQLKSLPGPASKPAAKKAGKKAAKKAPAKKGAKKAKKGAKRR